MKKSLLAMHAAVLLWGFTGVLGKAISLDFPVLVWYRMLLTALIIAGIITYRRGWVKVERRDLGRLILVGVLMGLHWVAFYGAIKFANASVALICLSTASIFTSILDPFINKSKWDLGELGFGLLALAGVAVIAIFDKQETARDLQRETGILLGIVAAVLSSVFTVFNKSIASKYPARTMVFWEMTSGWAFISVALMIAFATGAEKVLLNPSNTALHFMPAGWDWLWIGILALCCTVWAQSLALTALKRLSSFTVTLSVNLEPVYGILLAFAFFSENKELGGGFYIGVGMIILSVGLQMARMVRQRGYIAAKGGID